jgi:hypothetical protein
LLSNLEAAWKWALEGEYIFLMEVTYKAIPWIQERAKQFMKAADAMFCSKITVLFSILKSLILVIR